MPLYTDLCGFYKDKTVLVTGHTGFKGGWMTKILLSSGANVIGYSLDTVTEPSLYELCGLDKDVTSYYADIRDLDSLKDCFNEHKPEIVIHMAAQSVVRESYKNPVYTYETNIMGTVNISECLRIFDCVKSFVNVTTDKVYLNKETIRGYKEDDELKGFDPYSNSKSCSELVTSCYKNSYFFGDDSPAISVCRSGNAIGGGDFTEDRIIPDCVRAIQNNENIIIRNPGSIRPWQHVLEPVTAYIVIAMMQYKDKKYAGAYNIGPDEKNIVTVENLVSLFCELWNKKTHLNIKPQSGKTSGPHEAGLLNLDCSKIKSVLGLSQVWDIEKTVSKTVEWTYDYMNGSDVNSVTDRQIKEYFAEKGFC